VVGGMRRRHPALGAAIGAALALAVASFVIGSRLIDVITGYNSFIPVFIVNGLDDAQPFLLLAAVLLSGAALGVRHRAVLTGAALWAFGALASQVQDAWFRTVDLGVIVNNTALLTTYQDLYVAANALVAIGVLLIAWGVGRSSWRVGGGRVRPLLIGVVAVATLAALAGTVPYYAVPPDTHSGAFVADVLLTLLRAAATGIIAMVAVAVAAPGPPLDWRWPVGIGLGISLAVGAVTTWTSILSTGTALGEWWWTVLRGIGVGGSLLAAAGFAIAAAVRWPAPAGSVEAAGPISPPDAEGLRS
jgi:hypothetical protein